MIHRLEVIRRLVVDNPNPHLHHALACGRVGRSGPGWAVFACFIITTFALLGGMLPSASALEIIREVEPDANIKQQQNRGMFPNDILDQWIFNQQATISTARGVMKKKLDGKIKIITKVCGVSEDQKDKLELAGLGDIQSFMRECEKIQRGFDPNDQAQINNLWQIVQPLKNKFTGGLFGRASLFERVQLNCLTEEQYERLRKREAEFRMFALETAIRQMVVDLDQAAPFKEGNRDKFTEKLVEKVPLPLALETTQQRQMEAQYVLFRCSSIDRKELRPLFDDDGWKAFGQAMKMCRGYQSHFKSIGMIE